MWSILGNFVARSTSSGLGQLGCVCVWEGGLGVGGWCGRGGINSEEGSEGCMFWVSEDGHTQREKILSAVWKPPR